MFKYFRNKIKQRSSRVEDVREIVRCSNHTCHGQLILRKGKFYSCSEYPECKFTLNVDSYEAYAKSYSVIRKYYTLDISFPRTYIVLDFETTGLDPKLDKIMEVGAIFVQNGIEVKRFNELIKINIPIKQEIVHLTGIDNSMLEGCRNEIEVLNDLRNFIGDTKIIVAHNAKFDLLFLGYALRRLNIEPWSGDAICTYKTVRLLYPSTNSGEPIVHKLSEVCKYLGINFSNCHRALSDVLATNQVLLKIWEPSLKMGINPILTVASMVRSEPLFVKYKDTPKKR